MAGEAGPRVVTTHADGLDQLAAGGSRSYVVRAPFAGIVTAALYTPAAPLSGTNTNYRAFLLRNRGQNGAVGATVATISFTSGVDLVGFVSKVIPLGSGSAVVVAEGDVLEFVSFFAGTGAIDPGGTLSVTFARVTP